jgi:hypothetical protein
MCLQGVHSWSHEASQQVVAALPGVRTLVLRDCIIPAPQLAPLLSGGPITCVRLEGNSALSDGGSAAGQGLLDQWQQQTPEDPCKKGQVQRQ